MPQAFRAQISRFLKRFAPFSVFLAGACTGVVGSTMNGDPRKPTGSVKEDPGNPDPGLPSSMEVPPATVDMTPPSGLRRLSAAEYDATVRDLLGDDKGDSHLILPDDSRTPFDNDYTNQISSKTLVEGVELLAADAAGRLLKDTARRDRLIGCKPVDAKDATCLRTFVTNLGRRALRRHLASDEIERFMVFAKLAETANDFYMGVNAVIRALLQHPEFLNRVESGEPVAGSPGVFRLNDDEVAARLSYLLWGSMPNAALFALADRKQLTTEDGVRSAAIAMMAEPSARARIRRFHAMWIGFEELKQAPSLADAMRAETNALIDRVVFDERRPWQDIFRFEETFVGDTLAKHYGIPGPGTTTPQWVKWGDSGRRGLLSQGAFLQVGTKANDSSPTMRGLFVRRNLFCQPIAPPPPGVNTDEVPKGDGGSPCKKDRYSVHDQGGCKSCHDQVDPIGFGLEAYDKEGRFRTAEGDHPECAIDGEGEMVGVGKFNGPAELAKLALSEGLLNACVVEQLQRFASGRTNLTSFDEDLVQRMSARAGSGDFRLDALLLDLVASPTFIHRREEIQ